MRIATSGQLARPGRRYQHGGVGQCAQLGFAIRKGRGGTSSVLRKCWSVRCGADMVSARLRIVLDQPSPAARPGCCVRGNCGVRPLRQSYITPHCPQCPPVTTLKLRLVSVAASRPSGEGNRRYVKLPSLESVAQPSALPGRIRALRAAAWLPCGCRGTWASVRRFAQGVWSVACGQSCCVCPAHPVASPLRGIGLRWSARPPPRGSLIPAPAVTPPERGVVADLQFRCEFMYVRRYSAGMRAKTKNPAIYSIAGFSLFIWGG